jgi:hypothetical protein
MDRQLTPRQLLVLVLTACYDAGYPVLLKQKILDSLRELRVGAPALVPRLEFILSGNRHCCSLVEEAFNGLHLNGMLVFNALGGTIAVTDVMSAGTEVYKDLHDEKREKLYGEMTLYIEAFVQQVTRPDKDKPKTKPDPRFS